MDITFILLLISYCASLVILLSIPLRRRAVLLRAGRRIVEIKAKKRAFFKTLFIVLLCWLIIFVVKIRYFSVFVEIAFCGTAILGIEFAARQFSLMTLNGAWQNALIVDSEAVLYDDIAVFPVLQLPASEQKNYPKNVLVIETKSRGTVQLIFKDENLLNKVLDVVFTERPDLKPAVEEE